VDVQRPLSRRAVTAVAGAGSVGLLASATGCAVGAGSGGSPAPTDHRSAAVEGPSSAAPAQVARRVGGVVPEPPKGVQLPSGRRVGIRPVGTTANGVLDVPDDIDVAGWWDGGSKLGDPFGSTLVAAHVDSFSQGLGPFASLLSVRAGDRVVVWSQSLLQRYRVHSLRLRPRGVIGARSWLHSPAGEPRLTLVTCAGPYVEARGGYQNLAVVVAEPIGKVRVRPS
jgi:hypothetical protein